MKTTIEAAIAEKLATEISSAGFREYAEFMGLESETSSDIAEMTAAEIAEAAETTTEEAETLMLALAACDEPSLFAAYQILFESY
jgi:low affinity Fe/Cu permease